MHLNQLGRISQKAYSKTARLLSALSLALAVLGLAATPALATKTHHILLTFDGSPEHTLTLPTGLAVDNSGEPSKGDVYAAEGGPENEEDAIDCFTASGEYFSQVAGADIPQKSFAGSGQRWGLAVDPADGDLYAALPGLGALDKFEAGCGEVVSGFGSEGQISAASIKSGERGSPGTGEPFTPKSVAVDPKTSEVFVGDEANDFIDVFSSSGEYLRQFAVEGSPISIAIDSRGDLFVANREAVYVYKAATGLLNTEYGSGTGVLDAGGSRSVAVEPNSEDVYVADFGTEAQARDIYQYDSTGTEVSSFGSEAVSGPSQVAVGKADSDVYITNNGGYVSVFGPLVTLAEPTTEPATEVEPESAVLNGLVNPNGAAVKECYFEYEYARNGVSEASGLKAPCEEPDAEEIPINESPDRVHAKIALVPDAAYRFRLVVVNSEAKPITQTGSEQTIALPTAEADAVHTVNGEGKFSVFGVVDPDGSDTDYHFEFLTEGQFEEGAWAKAVSTTEQEAASGEGAGLVFQEIPALQPGATYRFRVTANSEAFPGITEHSPAKTLVVPALGPEGAQPPCPNEAERTGSSARLPDCRAYEQVTPADKEGAQDNFDYGKTDDEVVVGLDGEHVLMKTLSKWGQNVSGQGASTYSFTRSAGKWETSSLSPQPQTGGVLNVPYGFYTPDLSQALLDRDWETSVNAASPTVEFALGPPGGPYKTVASEPQEHFVAPSKEHGEDEVRHEGHWVAQSRNGAVAVIESPDHELAGYRTGTTAPIQAKGGQGNQGFDLYEYSGGSLSQVNLAPEPEGKRTVGVCGAELAQGREGGGNRGSGQGGEGANTSVESGSVNAVSANGSRIFFEAFPGGCPSPEEEVQRTRGGGGPMIELYMRVDGTRTVDIGNYTFEGANPEGTRLFLSRQEGSTLGFFSYDTETSTVKRLFSIEGAGLENKFALSEDGDVFYFETTATLTPEAPQGSAKIYRYDILSTKMTLVAVSSRNGGDGSGGFYVSPEGGDFYFNVESAQGVSGSGGEVKHAVEVYRYDSGENTVQCISCASPFDPEPQLLSTFMPEDGPSITRLAPLGSPASANGNYVFFDTPAALLLQDGNGEIGPEAFGGELNRFFSASSDVYEWRRDGVDGCGRVQGCLALITNGIDGTQNVLLGTDPSGTDVFIATHSQLVPTDTDQSGDVYDARIGGGFPPPAPRPIECEGDECSTPASAPMDPPQVLLAPLAGVSKGLVIAKSKSVKCARGRVLAHGKCVKRKARAKSKRARGTGKSSGRGGR